MIFVLFDIALLIARSIIKLIIAILIKKRDQFTEFTTTIIKQAKKF